MRKAVVALVCVLALLGAGSVANADPAPSSTVSVAPASVAPGAAVTFSVTLSNADADPLKGGKLGLGVANGAINQLFDVSTCALCYQAGNTIRYDVGDVPVNGSKTFTFSIGVFANAQHGQYVIEHQFVGDNYSYETLEGPTVTVS
ncbi:hypothetical protein G3I59_09790 [Amycolatopsis rubida]|uniref:Uncharacterized protein n=1 Tax=Amycolatopsis rubida TaxID=112413 RepID=A0A1I5HRR3_9PSEU|nr:MULTISPECIES: hypothetical protein [Amycolatopsis]MYW90885.1 hypothetical protein [Amycolatopsis rubida]NEC55870.1 hypothetical protein [Amycolatopsis rubida]OAP26049.1 hypothetical protein A4R44_03426 [Amycolatopsis sp. M39]SFO50992.1 hypothetical protein SAMN05421854_10238 [Amycolatopsis rubida]